MKNLIILFTSILTLCLTSCESEPSDKSVTQSEYFGEWKIDAIHISGIEIFYDSYGNVISEGYDTTELTGLVMIEELDGDTVSIDKLINSFDLLGTEVRGLFIDETVEIIHDFSTTTSNNYIRGEIKKEGDSLFVDYI